MKFPIRDIAVPGVQVVPKNTIFSQQKEIRFSSITRDSSGEYICKATIIDSQKIENQSWILNVSIPEKPTILSCTPNKTDHKVLIDAIFEMECSFSGIPKPDIFWTKIDSESNFYNLSSDGHTLLEKNRTKLRINKATKQDEGKYQCFAKNKGGSSLGFTVDLKIIGILNKFGIEI